VNPGILMVLILNSLSINIRSRQNPKILWLMTRKLSVTETRKLPVLGDFIAQERDVRQLSACGVTFVVRDILVHEPQSHRAARRLRAPSREKSGQ
jgi:hypothetical protein